MNQNNSPVAPTAIGPLDDLFKDRDRTKLPHIMLSPITYSGVEEAMVSSIVSEVTLAARYQIPTYYYQFGGDALITRSRSRLLGQFLDAPALQKFDVLMMIDHDLAWTPGDAIRTCFKAFDTQSICGGLYSKRNVNAGFASRTKRGPDAPQFLEMGTDSIVECEYLATGFIAIPRSCAKKIIEYWDENGERFDSEFKKAVDEKRYSDVKKMVKRSVGICRDYDGHGLFFDYFDVFDTFRNVHPTADAAKIGRHEYLSEDWAFCERAKDPGVKYYIYTYPNLLHFGIKGYDILGAQSPTEQEETKRLNEEKRKQQEEIKNAK